MIGFVGVSGFGVRVEQNARVRGRVQGVVMMAAKPLKVNVDMKGAPVWTLREATSEDAGKIAGLGDVFDANLVDGLISTSEGSALVASVRGSHAIDGRFSSASTGFLSCVVFFLFCFVGVR